MFGFLGRKSAAEKPRLQINLCGVAQRTGLDSAEGALE